MKVFQVSAVFQWGPVKRIIICCATAVKETTIKKSTFLGNLFTNDWRLYTADSKPFPYLAGFYDSVVIYIIFNPSLKIADLNVGSDIKI